MHPVNKIHKEMSSGQMGEKVILSAFDCPAVGTAC